MKDNVELSENLISEMIRLKAWYFGSKYFSVKNWLIFNKVKLPDGVDIDNLSD